MATNFPASLDSYSTKAAGNTVAEGHVNDPQDAIEAIQQKAGTGASGTIAQSASTNTALLGYGASLTGYTTVSLENRSLVTGTLPASAVAIGGQVQITYTQTGAYATGTTNIIDDNSIPQIAEGDEYMAAAIIPKDASNLLVIKVVWCGTLHGQNLQGQVSLFQDTTTNALASVRTDADGGYKNHNMIGFSHFMTAATTSWTCFKVRAGNDGSDTTEFNGEGGGRLLGGVMASSIVIMEIKR